MSDEPKVELLEPECHPVCPYCLANPAKVSSRGPLLLGNLHVMVIFCGNGECSKIWTVEVIGAEPAKAPFIVRPN